MKSCQKTTTIIQDLVDIRVDGPTYVYHDAGILETDVLRRLAMTTSMQFYPQPKFPIGPFDSCQQVAMLFIMCIDMSALKIETERAIARYFMRTLTTNEERPAFSKKKYGSTIRFPQILGKLLKFDPLTAEEMQRYVLRPGTIVRCMSTGMTFWIKIGRIIFSGMPKPTAHRITKLQTM